MPRLIATTAPKTLGFSALSFHACLLARMTASARGRQRHAVPDRGLVATLMASYLVWAAAFEYPETASLSGKRRKRLRFRVSSTNCG